MVTIVTMNRRWYNGYMGVPYGARVPISETLVLLLAKPVEYGIGGLAVVMEKIFGDLSEYSTSIDKYPSRYVHDSFKRLAKRGLATIKTEGDVTHLALTQKGKQERDRILRRRTIIQKPHIWDGKWRLIIFDIEEINRSGRDKLRRELKALGFFRLQNSVWIHPYDCSDIIALLKTDFKISRNTLFITAENVEGEHALVRHFGL